MTPATFRPIDERLYVAGRNPAWPWGGVCEVDDSEAYYIHHARWPARQEPEFWSPLPCTLISLVATNEWEHLRFRIPPHMQVSEGL